MSYAYLCQRHADDRKGKIVKIPTTTRIAGEYLFGLNNAYFIRLFTELQDLATSIYDDMIITPNSYGLKMLPITEGSVNLVSCFGNMLYAFGILGQLHDGLLFVNIEAYKKVMKKHKYNKAQIKLQDFGFILGGFNGKTFEKGITDFTVSYPDNPELITIIKAFSLAVQPFIENATTDKYYIDDIFNLFSFRPLEDKTTQKYETMFYLMTDYYSDNVREMLYAFHEKIQMIGFKYSDLYGSISYEKSGSRRISFGRAVTDVFVKDTINGRIIFNDINKLIDTIRMSDDKIKEPFYQSSCHFCGGRSSPIKPCPKRVAHEMDGNTYYNCKMVSFVFNDIKLADVDSLIQLIKIEYKV